MNIWLDKIDLVEKTNLNICLYYLSCVFSSPIILCPGYLMSRYKRQKAKVKFILEQLTADAPPYA